MKRILRYVHVGILLTIVWALIACESGTEQPTTQTNQSAQIETAAAQTVLAQLTQTSESVETQMAVARQTIFAEMTSTALVSTVTPTISTPTATVTPPIITDTPFPTPTPLPCDVAQYVADVSPIGSSALAPGSQFIQTFRIRNTGTCTWSPDYRLEFVDSIPPNGRLWVNIPRFVAPGETVDVSVTLIAPDFPGTYAGSWLMRNSSGQLFGFGQFGESPLWMQITVVQTPNRFAYDFVLNYCNAEWRSGVGLVPCGGGNEPTFGLVYTLQSPELESRRETRPALVMIPNSASNGFITGIYPPVQIQLGDRFQTEIGCLANSPQCNVAFELEYEIVGGSTNFVGSWFEVFDGRTMGIDLDLSPLAGNSVRFILSVIVENNQPLDANAFWLEPHIQRR